MKTPHDRTPQAPRHAEGDDGSIMILTLLILVTLSLIVISASNRTITETLIVSYDRFHKIAFRAADSGIYITPKLISETLNAKATPGTLTEESRTYGGFTYLYDGLLDYDTTAFTLYRELAGFTSAGSQTHSAQYEGNPADLWFTVGGTTTASVDITRVRSRNMVGGGAEFAAETDGSGVRMQGIYYAIDAYGNGPRESVSNLGALYLKVLGTAGGL